MKRLFCVIAVVLMVFAFVLPISAEETECLHDKYPGAIPIGAIMKYKPVDWKTHACYYVCDTCGEEITFSTSDHYIHEYDTRCDCGITRNEIAIGKAEEDATEGEDEVCLHENTEYRYEKHASTTEAPSVHIKFTFCLACEKYIASAVEAHEASGNMVCINCLQEGVAVTPPIEEPPVEEPPADDTTLPLPDIDVPEEVITTSDKIVKWIQDNLEEISVICTLILTVIYQARKHIVLNKSIATMNNNAITVAEKSDSSIGSALTSMQEVSNTVGGFVEAMNALLSEVRSNYEDNKKVTAKLDEATRFISTAKLANIELANEMAELLVLANIPNSKKEELYSRHRAAVNAIAAAEETEVKLNAEVDKEA